MKQNDILKLKNDDLIKYYDDSIEVASRHLSATKEQKNVSKQLDNAPFIRAMDRILHALVKVSIIILISVFIGYTIGVVISLASYGIIIAIMDKNSYEDIILLIGFGFGTLSTIIVAFMMVKKKKFGMNFLEKRILSQTEAYEQRIERLRKRENELELEIENIEKSNSYHNTQLLFNNPENIELMKTLRSYIRSGIVSNHRDAMSMYISEKRHKEKLAVKKDIANSNRDIAKANSEIARSIHNGNQDLARSIDNLSSQLSELKHACDNGTVTGEQKRDVLQTISSCTTLLVNLKELMKL